MTDEMIVESYFLREQSAISAMAERYGRFLFAISINILHNRQDAEECVNDVYLACWRTIPPERPRSLKAYAGALCRNISFDRYKNVHAQKRGGGRTETLLSEIEEFLPAECPDGGENLVSDAINDFLGTLKKEERIVFVRRYWFFDDIKDLAERMDFSESKVKSLLFRLRNRLKERLTREGLHL